MAPAAINSGLTLIIREAVLLFSLPLIKFVAVKGEGLNEALKRKVREEASVGVGQMLFVTEYVPTHRTDKYGPTQSLSFYFHCTLRHGCEPCQLAGPIDLQAGVYWLPLSALAYAPLLPASGAGYRDTRGGAGVLTTRGRGWNGIKIVLANDKLRASCLVALISAGERDCYRQEIASAVLQASLGRRCGRRDIPLGYEFLTYAPLDPQAYEPYRISADKFESVWDSIQALNQPAVQ